MSSPSPNSTPDDTRRSGGGAEVAGAFGPELEHLRQLLLEPEQRRLQALQARFDNPDAWRSQLNDILPGAFYELLQRDNSFAQVLAPAIEEGVRSSVERNPEALAEVLMPTIRVAVRRIFETTISSTVEAINRTLEHSLNVRWRVEAWRTGRPFAEVVMSHTLIYQVEQVFLIHRESGLLIQQVGQDDESMQDGDMVSAMLTAIQDFVRDSFKIGDEEALNVVQVGGLTVMIEQGSQAILAGVVRGTPRSELSDIFQDALSLVHIQFRKAFRSFDGDTEPFDEAQPALKTCLQSTFQATSKSPNRLLLVLIALLVLGGAFWIVRDVQQNRRWSDYLATLADTDGIVVTDAARGWSGYRVAGLRDPLADDPQQIWAEQGWSRALQASWQPYQGLEPSLIRRRAADLLGPPDGVSLTLDGPTLSLRGLAADAWTERATLMANTVAGIDRVDTSGLVSTSQLAAVTEQIEAVVVRFQSGSSPDITAGQDDRFELLRNSLAELSQLSDRAGISVRVEVIGHAGAFGSVDYREEISRARAERAAEVLRPSAPNLPFNAVGIGSQDPVPRDAQGLAPTSVSFRVSIGDPS
ncbi:MAG: hypothetical protein U5L04_13215 [Trueperaceae bacterium]|nr:hypothetical protein [Trueperaceae bacterium]